MWSLLIGQQHWGRGSSGPEASHGVASSGFAAFLGLELKHNWGLDVISSFTRTLSLVNRLKALSLKLLDADQNPIVLRV